MRSAFKSQEAREKIRGRYNQILGTFPFEKHFIETSFGKTFVLAAGTPENPPVLLLHGSCSNSAFWFGEMMPLSPTRRVLAVDILGEAGNSAENRLDLRGDGYADWLNELMDALSLREAAVAGNSLGGWMALKLAAKYPARVSKLALISAGGLAGVYRAPLERARSGEKLTIEPSLSGDAVLPPEVAEFINLILSGFLPIAEELPRIPDEGLARLSMPVLAVYGEKDAMLDSRAAAERLHALVPRAEIVWLETAGHIIPNAAEYLVPFLAARGEPT